MASEVVPHPGWRAHLFNDSDRRVWAVNHVTYARDEDREPWDRYVGQHPEGSVAHLYGWRDVIRSTYGHASYYLMLTSGGADAASPGVASDGSAKRILGVLPLFHLKHFLFGNALVSMPFMDSGGALADSGEAYTCLVAEAIRLGRRLGVSRVELRHEQPMASCVEVKEATAECSLDSVQVTTRSDKVRMLLELPQSAELLMKSLKSKLRSQISKPIREGLTWKSGGEALLDDFYRVFEVNMRDLGSPVHSPALMRNVLREFPDQSSIIAVYRECEPVAAALVVGSHTTLRNPWASFLRKYSVLSPNMLLYLRMLEHACDNGYRVFDFGRSTPGEGTYKFKEQWGAVPSPLYWQYISLDDSCSQPEPDDQKRFRAASRYWKKLPVIVTRIVGPRIRKHISL